MIFRDIFMPVPLFCAGTSDKLCFASTGMSYQTVLERLSQWAVEQPDKKVWTFLDDKGEFVEDYSYKVSDTDKFRAHIFSSMTTSNFESCTVGT